MRWPAVYGLEAEILVTASTSLISGSSAFARSPPSSSSFKRRRVRLRRSTRGGDGGRSYLPGSSHPVPPPWRRLRSWQEPRQHPRAACYPPCRVCGHQLGGRAQQQQASRHREAAERHTQLGRAACVPARRAGRQKPVKVGHTQLLQWTRPPGGRHACSREVPRPLQCIQLGQAAP